MDIDVLSGVLLSCKIVTVYYARKNIVWIDDEFVDKISFFIHFPNRIIQAAAEEIQSIIEKFNLNTPV